MVCIGVFRGKARWFSSTAFSVAALPRNTAKKRGLLPGYETQLGAATTAGFGGFNNSINVDGDLMNTQGIA